MDVKTSEHLYIYISALISKNPFMKCFPLISVGYRNENIKLFPQKRESQKVKPYIFASCIYPKQKSLGNKIKFMRPGVVYVEILLFLEVSFALIFQRVANILEGFTMSIYYHRLFKRCEVLIIAEF